MPVPQSGGRSNDSKPFLVLALAMAVPVGAGVYSLMLTKAPSTVSSNGFNVLKVDQTKEPRYYAPVAAAPPDESSPMPVVGKLKLAPSARGAEFTPSQTVGAYAARSNEGPMTPERMQEKQFLSQHNTELVRYESKLNRITTRYYRQDPVVREVDRAFGAMPRYMEVKRRHERDGDVFQFVRESLSLPEVRQEIKNRMQDPRVWRASLGMIFDTMKESPPPPTIYGAAKDFMQKDAQAADYMNGFTNDVFTNMPTTSNILPPNTDMGVLMKIVKDVKPDAMPAIPAMPSQASQPQH